MLFGASTSAGNAVNLSLIMWLRKQTTCTVLPRPISSAITKRFTMIPGFNKIRKNIVFSFVVRYVPQ